MADKMHRTLIGQVIKLSSANTIKVRVETKQTHPMYGKVIKSHKNYLAHATSEVKVGDTVKIIESKPLSKTKTWMYLETVNSK